MRPILLFARPAYRWLLPVAAALVVAGCKPAVPGTPPGFPPPVVTTMTVEPRDVPVTYEYVAQTAGYREVEIRARVTGILERRNYREGDAVRKGQSLFTIDRAPFEVALARTEADLAVAEARLAQAKRDHARLTPLIEAKAVGQKEYDDAVSAERVAAAEVGSARARVAEAKLNLDWTRVESPISGITSRAAVSEGALISGPQVLLTTVTQTDPMYVILGIPDREHLALKREVDAGRLMLPAGGRFKAQVKRADGSTYGRGGMLNFTDVRVHAQTGTSEARAEFPNPEGALRAGEFVRIILSGAVRPKAVLVPQRAVLESPKGKFVYLVNAEGKAQPQPVEVGEWNGDAWLVYNGLKAGDRVILDNVLKIGPGAPVKIADGAVAPAAPGGKPKKATKQ
jgi:membrane fusion protein, multidrug efflux system